MDFIKYFVSRNPWYVTIGAILFALFITSGIGMLVYMVAITPVARFAVMIMAGIGVTSVLMGVGAAALIQGIEDYRK